MEAEWLLMKEGDFIKIIYKDPSIKTYRVNLNEEQLRVQFLVKEIEEEEEKDKKTAVTT